MSYLDSSGNNTFFYQVGAMNWEVGAWRQLMKMIPVVQICKTNPIESMADFGCGAGDVKKILTANGCLPKQFVGLDISLEANADKVVDLSADSTLPSSSVDCISVIDLIQNTALDRRNPLYQEMDRVLKRGGLMYCFFRTNYFQPDDANKENSVGGESLANILAALPQYSTQKLWGVNQVEASESWPTMFPYEFNRIFYSLGAPELSKFNGIILRKE